MRHALVNFEQVLYEHLVDGVPVDVVLQDIVEGGDGGVHNSAIGCPTSELVEDTLGVPLTVYPTVRTPSD